MIRSNFRMTLFITATTIFILISNFVFAQKDWFITGSAATQYKMFIDSNNQHDGQNVMTLKSVGTDMNGFGALLQNMKPGKYAGKRVKMTGYLKSQDVAGWTGFWLRFDQAISQQFLSFDNMQGRPIKGTTGWKKYEIVLDVPNEASNIAFGALLNGTGQIWVDNAHFDIVDNSVPTTGQRKQD